MGKRKTKEQETEKRESDWMETVEVQEVNQTPEEMAKEMAEDIAAIPVLIPYKRSIANFDKKPYIRIEGYPILKERDVLKLYDDAVVELHTKLFGVAAEPQAAREAIIKIIMGE